MKRTRKSNRVAWAPEVNLCQVKLFLSDDYPLKVGQKYQDLQAKTSWMLHSDTSESSDLPPGFEDNHLLNQAKDDLSHIPCIKWKCPPQFVLSCNWHVASGEQSDEPKSQKLREISVLEAVYPRVSAIPPSPSVSLDVEHEQYDDSLTPLVPIIPIEEEEYADMKPNQVATADIPVTLQSQAFPQDISARPTPITSKSNPPPSLTPLASGESLLGQSPGLGADVVAATAAALATVMKSNEKGSMIDTDLLIKILSDPKMVENLTSEVGLAANSDIAATTSAGIPTDFKPVILSVPVSKSTPDIQMPPSNSKVIEKLTNDHGRGATSGGAPVNTVVVPTSRLKPASLVLPILKPTPDIHMAGNPKMIGKSTNGHGLTAPSDDSTAISTKGMPSFGLKLTSPSLPMLQPSPDCPTPSSQNMNHLLNGVRPTSRIQPPQQDTVLASGFKPVAPMSYVEPRMASLSHANGNLHAVANKVQPSVSTMPNQPNVGSMSFPAKQTYPVKDANYYKNLIRQHGADKQDTQDLQIGNPHSNFQDMKLVHNIKAGEVKLKFQKPCMYFKSSKGCRNGSNCTFQHEMSVQLEPSSILRTQNAKRMKL